LFAVIKKLFYLLPKGDPYKVAILFLMMMIAAALEVAGIGMIPVFVSIVASPDTVLGYDPLQPVINFLNIESGQDLLIWGSIALVGVFILKSIYMIGFNFFEARFINFRRYSISKRLMKAYMQAPYTFHLNRNTSELLRNLTREINVIITSVINDSMVIAREGFIAISVFLFLIFLEPLITLIVFLISGLGAGGFIFFTQKKVKQYGREEQGNWRVMLKSINEGLGGIKDVRLLNRETEFIESFRKAAYEVSRLGAYIRFIKSIPKPVVETTAVIGMMLIAGLMIFQGRSMDAIIPILTLFAMATVRLMPAVQQLSTTYTGLLYSFVSIEPVYDDLKELQDHNEKFLEDRKKKGSLKLHDRIQANNVVYSYPNSGGEALRGVSFEIPRGKAVAFVGESGAGKTTIVDLILGLLKPTSGEILVDGVNIHNHLSAWQRNIGYIPQSIYLTDDTLRKNIAFGLSDDEIDEMKINRAVELAQLNSLIQSLPNQLDTILGERGVRISGGQRQRVGIARALYHNPQVLVMDEATSALDNITEKQITDAIESLRGDRTIVTIAHRLTTVQNCNKLYLMKDGLIKDSGTYDELIEKNIEFRKMALVQ
jgi:ATP-binding cassette subfamily C protein